MSNRTISRTVISLKTPDAGILQEARTVAPGRFNHDRLADALDCLRTIEYRAPPVHSPLRSRIKVAAWNAERCKYPSQSAALLAGVDADIVLISELDIGMARSGNRHTVAELAAALGMGYTFGVEYVELGLGDEREKSWHADEANEIGLHGNGVLSRMPLDDLVVIRLDEGARWFAGQQSTSERRIGWRMAIGARVANTFLVSVHLESSTDANDRSLQVETLIRAIDRHAVGLPVVIGGDFNTAALPIATEKPAEWFAHPQEYEPLFAAFAAAGYDWQAANNPAATERTRPDGTPTPPFRKIDWFFTRDVAASQAGTVAAIDEHGAAISDHDLLWLSAAAA